MNIIGHTNDGQLIITMSREQYEQLFTGTPQQRPSANDVASQVLMYRRHHGFSQTNVANMLGISRNYLSQIERGQATNLSAKIRDKIDNMLNSLPEATP